MLTSSSSLAKFSGVVKSPECVLTHSLEKLSQRQGFSSAEATTAGAAAGSWMSENSLNGKPRCGVMT
eukprot:11755316-Alexandrium_andersonii.AAC.1